MYRLGHDLICDQDQSVVQIAKPHQVVQLLVQLLLAVRQSGG
jgi:hypothetical protein